MNTVFGLCQIHRLLWSCPRIDGKGARQGEGARGSPRFDKRAVTCVDLVVFRRWKWVLVTLGSCQSGETRPGAQEQVAWWGGASCRMWV